MLVNNNADLDVRNNFGQTPCEVVRENGALTELCVQPCKIFY